MSVTHEEIYEKITALQKKIDYNTKLLETIVETMPGPGKRPDLGPIINPLLNNPIIQNNPALKQMVTGVLDLQEGDK